MAIAKVADRGSTADTTSSTTTLVDLAAGGSIAVGNYLILRVGVDNSGASGALPGLTVSDTRSNTWTVLTGALQDPGAASAGAAAYIAYAKVANAYTDGDDITLTWGVATVADAPIIEEWSGIHATAPVAVSVVTAGGNGTTPSVSITPTASGQLVYGVVGGEVATQTYTEDADSTDGSWVELTSLYNGGSAVAGMWTFGGYKIVTGTTAQTWNPTFANTTDWAQAVVVFDAASGTDATAGSGAATAAGQSATTKVAPSAQSPSGSGVAHNPSPSVAPPASTAAATGAAHDATVTATSGTEAPATEATATAVAGDASTKVSSRLTALGATAHANNPTAKVAPSVESASASATSDNPQTSVHVNAGSASASVAASGVTGNVAVSAVAATASASANGPSISLAVTAGSAAGVVGADDPTIALLVSAAVASVAATAHAPTLDIVSSNPDLNPIVVTIREASTALIFKD